MVAVFVFDLHKTRNQPALACPIDSFCPHDFRISERLKHCIKPIRHWNAVIVGEEDDCTPSFDGTMIASCRWAAVCLRDEANIVAIDHVCGIVRRAIVDDQDLNIAA